MNTFFESLGTNRKPLLATTTFVLFLLMVYFFWRTPQATAPIVTDVAATTTAQATSTVQVAAEETFQNEPDTVLVALDVKPWKWLSATNPDGTVVTPAKKDAFLIRFNASGAFAADTDCNSVSGSYEARNGSLSLGSIASTKMFCEGSQEAEFTALLSDVLSYRFADGAQLIMTTTDGTEVIFR